MRDKDDNLLAFGDEVYCFIDGHGSPGSYGVIIGVMNYASTEREEIVCIASERYSLGMPVNTAHLTRTVRGDPTLARRLRADYLKRTPKAFRPMLED